MTLSRTRKIVAGSEQFSVSQRADGVLSFRWLTGPNPGYGFNVGGYEAREPTEEELVSNAVAFLSMIDPATGFVG